jgi:hypothetical protein
VSDGSVNAADVANKKWSAFLARNAQYINRQSKTWPGERILLENPVINALCRRRVQPVIPTLPAKRMNDTTTIRAIEGEKEAPARIIETDLPGRLDRLPWGRFHTLIVLALGITWLLDGLEVTLAGAVASALKTSHVLKFSNADVGFAGSAYIAGAVIGALGFGWLTDRLGRRKLFFITLFLYVAATAATAV